MNELTTEILDNIKPFSGTPGEITNQVIGSGNALQQTKTAYTTAVAVQQPRSITKITNNVLEEARLAGKSFYWGWKVKDKKTGKKVPIEGPSIDLAMCLARNYGNCVVDVEGTETPTHFMLKGVFIDLETGFTVPRLFRQRKSQSLGSGYGADRSEDMVFQIAQSKAQRNAIIKAMPDWLVQKAIETAKAAESSQIENLAESRAKAVEYFGSNYGIAQDRLEAVIGRPADQWVKMDLVELKGTITAIKEGRVKAEEAFPKIESEQSGVDTIKTQADNAARAVRAVRDAARAVDVDAVPNNPEQSGTVRTGQEQSGPVKNSSEQDSENPPDGIQNSVDPESDPPIKTQWKDPRAPDPRDRWAWGGLRRGTPAKGTGLAAHIARNQAAFEEAWPTMPDELKNELADKYQRFYGMELPWIAKNDPACDTNSAVSGPTFEDMDRYNQIHATKRKTQAYRYAMDQITGDKDNTEPLTPDLIQTFLKHYDEMSGQEGLSDDILERFHTIFNSQRLTPAWHYAQGIIIGDENSSFRPNEKDIQAWLRHFNEFSQKIDLGDIPDDKY